MLMSFSSPAEVVILLAQLPSEMLIMCPSFPTHHLNRSSFLSDDTATSFPCMRSWMVKTFTPPSIIPSIFLQGPCHLPANSCCSSFCSAIPLPIYSSFLLDLQFWIFTTTSGQRLHHSKSSTLDMETDVIRRDTQNTKHGKTIDTFDYI